ncbi:MAG: hypothetical protein ABIO70_28460, partial [Pseudomonadota bacterium]
MRWVALALLAAGCARPAGGPRSLTVPGAPEGCRASWVLSALPPPGGGAVFRQVPGEVELEGFGACTLMGPVDDGRWLWVLMSFEPGWRGAIRCQAGGRRSPELVVGGPEVVAPVGVKVDLAGMDEAEIQAVGRGEDAVGWGAGVG